MKMACGDWQVTNEIWIFPFAYLNSTQRFSQGCVQVCNAFVAPKHSLSSKSWAIRVNLRFGDTLWRLIGLRFINLPDSLQGVDLIDRLVVPNAQNSRKTQRKPARMSIGTHHVIERNL